MSHSAGYKVTRAELAELARHNRTLYSELAITVNCISKIIMIECVSVGKSMTPNRVHEASREIFNAIIYSLIKSKLGVSEYVLRIPYLTDEDRKSWKTLETAPLSKWDTLDTYALDLSDVGSFEQLEAKVIRLYEEAKTKEMLMATGATPVAPAATPEPAIFTPLVNPAALPEAAAHAPADLEPELAVEPAQVAQAEAVEEAGDAHKQMPLPVEPVATTETEAAEEAEEAEEVEEVEAGAEVTPEAQVDAEEIEDPDADFSLEGLDVGGDDLEEKEEQEEGDDADFAALLGLKKA